MAYVASWQHVRTKVRCVVGRIIFGVLTLLQLAAIPISEARAVDASVADFPFLITCDIAGVRHAFYLSKISKDELAVYATLAGQAGTITLTGTPKRVGGAGTTSTSCGARMSAVGLTAAFVRIPCQVAEGPNSDMACSCSSASLPSRKLARRRRCRGCLR
jgi:hypothetical protein